MINALLKIIKNISKKIFSITNERYHKVIYIFGLKIAITVRDKKPYLRFSQNIGYINYEIVHILHATGFAVKLVEFLNSFVDRKKHLFIFKSGPTLYFATTKAENIIEGNLNTLKIDLRKTKKIIVHSLLFPADINYFYNNPQLLKITYWSIFGGDLYNCSNNYKANYVKSNVKAIITVFDEQEYNKQFGEKLCFKIIYPDNCLSNIEMKKKKIKGECINILANHCADPSTIDILNNLYKFKDENIKITTIVSYGTVNKKNRKKDIIKLGYKLFKDKFNPITKWLSIEDYSKLMEQQDIIILGMQRQQGIGNLRLCTVSGAKAFLNAKNPIYSSLKEIGLSIYNANIIPDMSFDSFINYDDNRRLINRNIFIERAKPEYIQGLWNKVFDYAE